MKRPIAMGLISLPLAAAMVCAGGCTQSLAWFVAQFAPPKKVQALYEPPKDQKVLVLVEDKPAPVSFEPIKYELAERIGRKLVDRKIARETVSQDRLLDLTNTRDYHLLSISEVGQKLGADLVLYVQVESFSLKDSPQSPLWQGRFATSVWVVDAKKPQRLWPKDTPTQGSGYRVGPVEFKHSENPSPSHGEEIARGLAEEMSEQIVRLFYDHEEARDRNHDEGPRQSPD
jgi:hypothetical protein